MLFAWPLTAQSNRPSSVRPGAAAYLIDTWQTSEGLPHNSLNAVLQAQDGYLWIASGSGLARFDGVRFESFREVPVSLPARQALTLREDSQRRLWVGTVNGCAFKEKKRWTSIPLSKGDLPGDVRAIAEAPAGTLWFGSNIGLHRWRAGQLRYFGMPGAPTEAVRSVLPQSDGSLLILTVATVYEFRDGKFTVRQDIARRTGGRELWALARDREGRVWVCGYCVLLRQEGVEWREMGGGEPSLAGHHVAFLAARNGDIWIATRSRGVQRWRQGRWLPISTDDGLAHDDVRGLCEDGQGDIWVASNGGGLSRLKPRLLEVFSRESGLGRYVTSALTESADGTIWIGTDGGGVWRWRDGSIEPFSTELGFTRDAFVWSLCAGRDGSLWMGSFANGLFRYQDGQTTHFKNTHGLTSTWFPALFEDHQGALWAGSHPGGVFRFDGASFTEVRAIGSGRRPSISSLAQTRDGAIWAGTGGEGLLRWAEGRWSSFHPADGLPSDTIAALHEDGNGVLWIGSGGGGLGWFWQGKFGAISTREGLPDGSVLEIQSDAEGNLWVGTTLGLARLSRSSLREFLAGHGRQITAVLYGKPDGLLATQFMSDHCPLSLRARDGALWFALANGVLRVDPARTSEQTNVPVVVIETVLAANAPMSTEAARSDARAPALSQPLIVPAGRNNLEFRYTALELASPEKVRFLHRLAGLDADWQSAGAQRVANYRYVPPGEYRFEVRACGADGLWNEQGASIRLVVQPFFWQAAWFRAVFLLALLVAVGVGVRAWVLHRVRRRLERLEQERRLHQERARIAQDLHDDLGSSLTEINFLGSLPAAENQVQPVELRQRLGEIVRRARRLTKALDEIVWAVNPKNDSLTATANYLCSRVQESARAAAVRCRLDMDTELPEVALSSELRHHLLMAVNEAVTNALRHSAATEIRVCLHVRAGQLEIAVEDNGCGFDLAGVKPGRNGLRNMEQRLKEVGGDFELRSAPGQGTTIRLTLPLK